MILSWACLGKSNFVRVFFFDFFLFPFSDLFDPVVSPFKVSMDVVMAFIKNGFESGSESLQRQTLTWLQVCRAHGICIQCNNTCEFFTIVGRMSLNTPPVLNFATYNVGGRD